jgi:uncharacterized lipoprotein NlpE involved in copper resistance
MKKLIVILLLISLVIMGCGNSKTIDGVEYDTIGIISQEEDKNPNIQYKPIWGNIIWGSLLSGTLIAPIYFFGFSMWEPVGKKDNNKLKGQIN